MRAKLKALDALTLGPDRLDPICERLHELLLEFAGTVVDELASFIEELVGMADIGFGLMHAGGAEREALREKLRTCRDVQLR